MILDQGFVLVVIQLSWKEGLLARSDLPDLAFYCVRRDDLA